MKEKRKKRKTATRVNKERQKRARGDRSYNERVRAKSICCAFKLGFLQLICKASLIFEVEYRVSFINYVKTKRIILVKACCGEV